jgi:hypothetical protein
MKGKFMYSRSWIQEMAIPIGFHVAPEMDGFHPLLRCVNPLKVRRASAANELPSEQDWRHAGTLLDLDQSSACPVAFVQSVKSQDFQNDDDYDDSADYGWMSGGFEE